jgi:O-antigen ligase
MAGVSEPRPGPPGGALLLCLGLGVALGAAALVLAVDPYVRAQVGIAPVAVVGVVVALASSLAWPGLVLAVVPATVVVNTSHGFFLFELCVFGMLVVAALDALRRRDAALPGPAEVHFAFLALLASGCLSLVGVSDVQSFMGALVRLLTAYAGMLLVWRYARGPRWAWVAASVPIGGAAVAAQVLHSYTSHGSHLRNLFLLRSFLSNVGWGQTNYVGAVLSVLILGSFVLLLLSRRPWLRLLCGGSLALMLAAMVMLVSRGTIVAVALGLLALITVMRGRRRWLVLLFAALAVVLVLQVPAFKVMSARFTTSSQGFSLVVRVRLWQEAAERFLAHPVLGVGLGQGRFQADALQSDDPHNYFLTVASETGLPGLLAWVALLVVLYRAAARAARGRPEAQAWGAALAVLVSVAVAHSCYEPTFTGTHYMYLFFWVYAVIFQGMADAAPREAP